MSGQATGWVLRRGPRDRALRLVLIAIADAANRDGEHAHPGMDAIVDGALYSPGHVRRAIAKLVEDGWLEIEESAAPGRATSYRIPGVREEVEIDGAHSARRSSDGARTSRVLEVDGARTSRAQTRAPTLTVDPTTTDLSLTLATDPAMSLGTVEAFDLFWQAYPRHTGRGQAFKAWQAARRKVDVDTLIAGAARYRDDPNRDDQYTKHPATWLNGECWADDPLPARRAAGRRQGNQDRNFDRLGEAWRGAQ